VGWKETTSIGIMSAFLATQRNLDGGIFILRHRTKAKISWHRDCSSVGGRKNFYELFLVRPDGESARVVLI
jgi:hypothetical protein